MYGAITHSYNFISHQTVLTTSILFLSPLYTKKWLSTPWISFKRCIYKAPYEIYFYCNKYNLSLQKKPAFPNHLSGLIWSFSWRSKSLQCFCFSFNFSKICPIHSIFSNEVACKVQVSYFLKRDEGHWVAAFTFLIIYKNLMGNPPDKQIESAFK